ncbi:MAG: hypothetical protein U9Q62_11615 [Campylobacterota bacterium]|nr:hypothetical protein [Campylobacterota bacterium]
MIISDSTTLIILSDLGRIDLLENLFSKLYMPQAVHEEMTVKKGVRLPDFMQVVTVKNSELLESLKLLLDDGESEAIALAVEKSLPLIIDEKKGRKIALNAGVKIIGLLGIIYLNIRREFMTQDEAGIFLNDAIKHGYRINAKLIDDMFKSLQ